MSGTDFHVIEYVKGGNRGGISYHPNQATKYMALTATASKWYKTRRGAEQFMERHGYAPAK